MLAAAALTLLSFSLHLGLGAHFRGLGVCDEWNVLFDADPNVYLTSFAGGGLIGPWGGRSFVHPNLSNFVHPPLVLLARSIERLHLSRREPRELRRDLAMGVAPLFAALRVPVLLALFRLLGFPLGWGGLFCLLDLVSFSGLLFGSLPESYGPTGTLLAVTYLLVADAIRPGGRIRHAAWLATGVVVTGITISNLLPFALIYGLTVRFQPRAPRGASAMAGAAVSTALMTAAVAALTFGIYRLGGYAAGSALPFSPHVTPHVFEAWDPDLLKAVRDFPLALANTFAPGLPGQVPKDFPGDLHSFTLTFAPTGRALTGFDLRSIAILAALAVGMAGHLRAPHVQRAMTWAIAGVMAFSWLFYSLYGRELFLYSQHWQVTALLMLAGIGHLRHRFPRAVVAGTVLLGLLIAAQSALQLGRITRLLATPGS